MKTARSYTDDRVSDLYLGAVYQLLAGCNTDYETGHVIIAGGIQSRHFSRLTTDEGTF